MSGVALRCPNCGTIAGSEGQCDACHEASVRYFCTNHTPGLWLEGTACPQCGARFGDPEPMPDVPRSVERPVAPVRPARMPRPTERDPELGPWDREAPADLGSERGRSSTPDPFRILLGAMAAAARARSMRAERPDIEDWESTPRRRGGGCVGRLVMLLLILIALFLLLPVFLGALLGFG